MQQLHSQYKTDTAGKQPVILPASEFNTLVDELDEQEDIRLYLEAKKRIPANAYYLTII